MSTQPRCNTRGTKVEVGDILGSQLGNCLLTAIIMVVLRKVMVKKIFNVLNGEISGLHQAAYLLGFFAICSQVLALFRDRLLASYFGAGETLDLYYAAFRIPDILFVLVGSVVSISVVIPFLVERMDKGESEAKKFVDSLFTFYFVFMVIAGITSYLTAPIVMAKLFPPFKDSQNFHELVGLTKVLLLSPAFLGFSNLLASITQTNKRFFVYAISPVFYNLGIIFGIVFLYPIFGLIGLGFGVIIGAFLHFAIQIPYIYNIGLLPTLRFPIEFGFIKNIILTSLPRTITVSSNEIAELFLVSFASMFLSGSVSVFNFSFNLQSVPFSIIGVSYSLAAFPTLTRLFSDGNKDEFVGQMISSSRHIIFWSVPVSVLFVVLRAQIVRTILGSGRFNWDDTRLTAAALAIFTFSLVAQNLVALFVRSYYSQGKTKTPLIMNIFSALILVYISYALVQIFQNNNTFKFFIEALFKVTNVPGTAVLMLPLGYTIGLFINLLVHWVGFQYHFKSYSGPVLRTTFEVFGASTIMGFVSYLGLEFFGEKFNLNTLPGIFFQGFFAGIVGIVSGVLVLYLLNNKELSEVWSTMHKKIWKAKAISPDAELV